MKPRKVNKARGALDEQAVRDPLTGLYNRRYFGIRIVEEIARAERDKHPLAILLCNLDRFKDINDKLGYQTGDEVLKATALCIQQATRGADLAFRWGGDEIVVVLSKTDREGILIAADRIRKEVHRIGERHRLTLDVSIGVSLYPEHGSSVDELIRLADRALYIAKRKGGDKTHIGEEEYRLDEGVVRAVFQPVKDAQGDQILGYEALSRDAQGQMDIRSLFKKYQAVGQLQELKRLCFLIQLRESCKAGLKRVFINVDFQVLSRVQPLPHPDATEVVLEISEAEALYDVEIHLEVIQRWRALGYQFAIDDFGAGFISLPFIARLVPDYIKLDRSTMLQAVSSGQFKGFLKGLIAALRNFSQKGIIAEGIETEKELALVRELGIDFVQGFLLGRPEPLNP